MEERNGTGERARNAGDQAKLPPSLPPSLLTTTTNTTTTTTTISTNLVHTTC